MRCASHRLTSLAVDLDLFGQESFKRRDVHDFVIDRLRAIDHEGLRFLLSLRPTGRLASSDHHVARPLILIGNNQTGS